MMVYSKRPSDDSSQPPCKRLSASPPGSSKTDAISNEDAIEINSLSSSIASRLHVLLETTIAAEVEMGRKANASQLVNESQNISTPLLSFLTSAKHMITRLTEKHSTGVILNCEKSEISNLQLSNDVEKENAFSVSSAQSTSKQVISTSSSASSGDPLRWQIISKLQFFLFKNLRFYLNEFQSNFFDETPHLDFSVENAQNCLVAVVEFLQATNTDVQFALEQTINQAERLSLSSNIINPYQNARPLENNLIPNIENQVANKVIRNCRAVRQTAEEESPVRQTAEKESPVRQTAEEVSLVRQTAEEVSLVSQTVEEASPVRQTEEEESSVRKTAEQESPEIVELNTRDIQRCTENSELITIDEDIDTVSKSEKVCVGGQNCYSEVLTETEPEVVIIKDGTRNRVLDFIDLSEKEVEVEASVGKGLHRCSKCNQNIDKFDAEFLMEYHRLFHAYNWLSESD